MPSKDISRCLFLSPASSASSDTRRLQEFSLEIPFLQQCQADSGKQSCVVPALRELSLTTAGFCPSLTSLLPTAPKGGVVVILILT